MRIEGSFLMFEKENNGKSKNLKERHNGEMFCLVSGLWILEYVHWLSSTNY